MDAGKFSFHHPQWQCRLARLFDTLAGEFASNVRVSCRKLVFSKLEKDTPFKKPSGNFATIIIQLPSIYQGGSVDVILDDEKLMKNIDFGASVGLNPYECNYAAFFTNYFKYRVSSSSLKPSY